MSTFDHRSGRRMGQLKCEIEFLAVGDGSKAGDAIVIRYGDVNAYNLMLIDGGHAEQARISWRT
jgi:hypothetical protein